MSARAAFGLDLDRTGEAEPLRSRLRRRLRGRYPVDAFGADPMIADVVDPVVESLCSAEVVGGDTIPEIGPAVLVTNRRHGPGDPFVVRAAVRDERRRRARVVASSAELPGVGGVMRRLAALRNTGVDIASALRAGHIVVVPLAPSFRPLHAGAAPVEVLWGAIGFPVIPVAVTGGAGGTFGLPLGHHRVSVGEPLDVDVVPRDPLSAAELAAAARAGVQVLLDASY